MVKRLLIGVSVAGLAVVALAMIAAATSAQQATPPQVVLPSTRPAIRPGVLPSSRPALRPGASVSTRPATRPAPTVIRPFVEPGVSGAPIAFPDAYHGKLVLIHFWRTSCPYCRKELEFWKEAYGRYHDRGLEIIGIATDKNMKLPVEKFQAFVAANDMTWEQIYENGPRLAQSYGITSLPTSFLVDGSTGAVLASGRSIRRAGLVQQIEAHLPAGNSGTTRPAP